MRKILLFSIPLTILFAPVFAQTFLVAVYNPYSFNITNYQIEVNLSKYFTTPQYLKVFLPNGTLLNFCYVQPNGACNQTLSSDVIWIKVPLLKAHNFTYILIQSTNQNYAVDGSQVFIFYDDFLGTSLDTGKYIIYGNSYNVSNGKLYISNLDTHICTKVAFTVPFVVITSMKALEINKQLGLELCNSTECNLKRFYFLITGAQDVYIDANGDGQYEVVEDLFTDTAGDKYFVKVALTQTKIYLYFVRNGVQYNKVYNYGWSDNTYVCFGGYEANLPSTTGNVISIDFVEVAEYYPNITYTVIPYNATNTYVFVYSDKAQTYQVFVPNITKYVNVTENNVQLPFCYVQPNGACNQTLGNGIWVKANLQQGINVIEIKPASINLATDGSNVFVFYDDFLGTSLNTSKWGYNGAYSISNGLVCLTESASSGFTQIYTLATFNKPFIVEARIKMGATEYGNLILVTNNTAYTYRIDYADWYHGSSISDYACSGFGGTSAVQTGVPVDGTFHVFGIIINSQGYPYFLLDGKMYEDTNSQTNLGPYHIAILETWLTSTSFSNYCADWIRVRAYDPNVATSVLFPLSIAFTTNLANKTYYASPIPLKINLYGVGYANITVSVDGSIVYSVKNYYVLISDTLTTNITLLKAGTHIITVKVNNEEKVYNITFEPYSYSVTYSNYVTYNSNKYVHTLKYNISVRCGISGVQQYILDVKPSGYVSSVIGIVNVITPKQPMFIHEICTYTTPTGGIFQLLIGGQTISQQSFPSNIGSFCIILDRWASPYSPIVLIIQTSASYGTNHVPVVNNQYINIDGHIVTTIGVVPNTHTIYKIVGYIINQSNTPQVSVYSFNNRTYTIICDNKTHYITDSYTPNKEGQFNTWFKLAGLVDSYYFGNDTFIADLYPPKIYTHIIHKYGLSYNYPQFNISLICNDTISPIIYATVQCNNLTYTTSGANISKIYSCFYNTTNNIYIICKDIVNNTNQTNITFNEYLVRFRVFYDYYKPSSAKMLVLFSNHTPYSLDVTNKNVFYLVTNITPSLFEYLYDTVYLKWLPVLPGSTIYIVPVNPSTMILTHILVYDKYNHTIPSTILLYIPLNTSYYLWQSVLNDQPIYVSTIFPYWLQVLYDNKVIYNNMQYYFSSTTTIIHLPIALTKPPQTNTHNTIPIIPRKTIIIIHNNNYYVYNTLNTKDIIYVIYIILSIVLIALLRKAGISLLVIPLLILFYKAHLIYITIDQLTIIFILALILSVIFYLGIKRK